MIETFQTLLQFCGIISVALAVPMGVDRLSGRRHRRVVRKAAYDVLIAHILSHPDQWTRTPCGSYDYDLKCGPLTVSFSFSSYGTYLNHCKLNNELIPDSIGWKLHRAFTGGDTDLSHVIVRSLRPQTPLALASAVS